MEISVEEEEVYEPASPSSQYLNSSNLSLSVIAVLESKIPLQYEESLPINLLKDVFVPINPRFSSIMVTGKKGTKKWKRVEVKYEEHIKNPVFPTQKPVDFYDECISNYISNLAMETFPQNRPLWEIHIFKYPTSDAAGSIIFKLHHSLGDGYSLMGALLSCLQRVDNPSLPLTFPSRQRTNISNSNKTSIFKSVPRFFKGIMNTVYDFGWSTLKSTLVEDDRTAIRSGEDGVEFRPIALVTKTFSLDSLKQIKDSLNVTINDVITGIVIYGTRLYMQEVNQETCNGKCNALVLFNTRALGGYKSVSDMIRPNSDMPWGNHFTFLPVTLPNLTILAHKNNNNNDNPLAFVQKAHQIIERKRNSGSVWLTSKLLDFLKKLRGPEATARFIHGTLKNTSMALTNLIGPVEEMALANHPVKGLYFAVTGAPQSLSVTIMSYVDKLRIAIVVEKDFIDQNKLKSCIEFAYDSIFKAALNSSA